MSLRLPFGLIAGLFVALAGGIAAQDSKGTDPQNAEPKHVAYPQHDLLTPFRSPAEVYAPPDHLFMLLRRMQAIAGDPHSKKDFDSEGREIVDDSSWQAARTEVDSIGLDAGYLAAIMRMSKNAADRETAFYAAFFCKQPDYVVNLISHIPGEPVRKTREESFPRAIAYLRAHLGRRFGDLSEDEKKVAILGLPQLGSPAAKAAGITRAPRDDDHLLDLRMVPFFQMLDLDDPIDQAQGLWFLKEVFTIRDDIAKVWLEPALPRVRQLLDSKDSGVREQAIGVLHIIGPKDLAAPETDADPEVLRAWAEKAIRAMFPPIRNLNNAIVQLFPSEDRDAIVAAGKKALEGASLGDPSFGTTKDGTPYRGFRVLHVPDALKILAIPEGAVITGINGQTVDDSASVLKALQDQLTMKIPRRLLRVTYVVDDAAHAVEYRIM